jgi:hypothetical protein
LLFTQLARHAQRIQVTNIITQEQGSLQRMFQN